MPATNDADRCAHEACVCRVPDGSEFGEYCSAHCRDHGDIAELRCECGHPGCMADQGAPPRA
jgi:hypothetical protein